MDQQTIADYPVGGAASTPTYRYVYASYIDEPVVRKTAGAGGTLVYFHRNHQYSITAVTTSTGSIAERYAYSAYGQPTILDTSASVLSSSAINNRYTYTGREWDATLGLHHFRARWMSPSAGRFLGRDSIGYVDGYSLYGFQLSLDLFDPFGLSVGDGDGGSGSGTSQDCTGHKLQSPGFKGGINPGIVRVDAELSGSISVKTCKTCCDGRGSVWLSKYSLSIQGKIKAKGSPYQVAGHLEVGRWVSKDWVTKVSWNGFLGVQAFGEVKFEGGGAWNDTCEGEGEALICISGEGEAGLRLGGNLNVEWGKWKYQVGAYGQGSVRSNLTVCWKCKGASCNLKSARLCSFARASVHLNLVYMNYNWDISDVGYCADLI
jgi:RHS repeat-associated protein